MKVWSQCGNNSFNLIRHIDTKHKLNTEVIANLLLPKIGKIDCLILQVNASRHYSSYNLKYFLIYCVTHGFWKKDFTSSAPFLYILEYNIEPRALVRICYGMFVVIMNIWYQEEMQKGLNRFNDRKNETMQLLSSDKPNGALF